MNRRMLHRLSSMKGVDRDERWCATRCVSGTRRPRRTWPTAAGADATARASAAAARSRRRCSGRASTRPTSVPAFPRTAVAASLGCGNPLAVVELREGETVLDLGSGGGIDVLLSGKRVGPTRNGLRARHDRRDAGARAGERSRTAGATNVHFLKGLIEDIPLACRERRRRHLELRREPVAREGASPRGDRARPAAGRPGRDLGRRRGRPPLSGGPRRAREPRRLHRRRALGLRVSRGARGGAGSSTSRSSSTHTVADGMHGAIVRARKPL